MEHVAVPERLGVATTLLDGLGEKVLDTLTEPVLLGDTPAVLDGLGEEVLELVVVPERLGVAT
ncbi:MAG: hypothetical protein EBT86_06280, partial [Actinobacteria bacterium]|nr:hypothetical protein [Actinomycetota bacterium]